MRRKSKYYLLESRPELFFFFSYMRKTSCRAWGMFVCECGIYDVKHLYMHTTNRVSNYYKSTYAWSMYSFTCVHVYDSCACASRRERDNRRYTMVGNKGGYQQA